MARIGGVSMIVTGTDISMPDVRRFGWSSIIATWVIPTLYPAKLCILGSVPFLVHDLIRATGFFAFFLGLNASDPRRGLCIVGIYQTSSQKHRCMLY
jgi:hypothetical protein